MDAEVVGELDRLAGGVGIHLFVFWLGALFGSFANVCIARLPLDMSIVRPGSHCFACQTPVAWYDNVPILAYLWLRGACRHCKAGFSPRYLLVEAGTGLLFAATWHLCLFALEPEAPLVVRVARFCVYALFLFVMVVITFIDLDTMKILNRVSLPSIPVFYALGLTTGDLAWWEGLLGIAVGYGSVRLISDGYYWLTGREGMGYGDGKLLAVVGALLGWRGVIFSLFGGALIGSLVIPAIGLIYVRRYRRAALMAEPAPAVVVPPAGTDFSGPQSVRDPGPERDVDGVDDDQEGAGTLRHFFQRYAVPFGPFLVAAAITYLFLQQAIEIHLAGLPSLLAT